MSKCWYCNNELTTGDNPKHFGICNKCYDEMFKSGDTIIRSFTNKISDLEEKLKALRNGIIDDETLNMLVKEHKLYKDLEAKLAESEKKAYSRGHSQRDIANEIKLNALREDVANKEKRIVELKQQLAESEKERHEEWKTGKEWKWEWQKVNQKLEKAEQDKISFAVEQLEKVKEHNDNLICDDEDYYNYITAFIDNQIKQLKEMK